MLNPVTFTGIYKVNNISRYDLRKAVLDMNNRISDKKQFDFGCNKLNQEAIEYPKIHAHFDVDADENYIITGKDAELVDGFYDDFYCMSTIHAEEQVLPASLHNAYFQSRDALEQNISLLVNYAKEDDEVESLNFVCNSNNAPKFDIIG